MIFSVLLAVFSFMPIVSSETPLDLYVHQADASSAWTVTREQQKNGCTIKTIDLTSQTWRSEAEVTPNVWHHQLTVVIPPSPRGNTGLLHVTGGYNNGQTSAIPEHFVSTALMTSTVVAELKMVPTQFLHFSDESDERYTEKGRKEDQIIAYGYDKFLKTLDPLWIPTLPMTKAVVAAMDVCTEVAPVTQFVIAGASKRGWTTWTTAAVDKRVVGIIPMVIDILNLRECFDRHLGAYGFWSSALNDYIDLDVEKRLHSPEFAQLMAIIEPFNYRDRLTMPKLLINSAGDEFFLPDSSQLYFNQLLGPKYLRYLPNASHNLAGTNFMLGALGFYTELLHGLLPPTMDWSLDAKGVLSMTASQTPKRVVLWQATNPNARDFRHRVIGSSWTSTPLKSQDERYQAELETPEAGFSAYFIEATFANRVPGAPDHTFTTDVFVLPDILPYEHLTAY